MTYEVNKTGGIVYRSAVDLAGRRVSLALDFYAPRGRKARSPLPLVVFAHGGYFLDGSREDMDPYCDLLARRGYAAATIDYRLGISARGGSFDSVSVKEAVWRAMQDGRAALRFFAERAGEYGIDPAAISFGGYSAGAVTALHIAYLDKPGEIPPDIDTARLGGFEEGRTGPPARPRAVISLAGALGDTAWMEDASDPPLACIHGRLDQSVPFGHGAFMLPGPGDRFLVYGAGPVTERAAALGIPHRLKAYDRAGHEAPFLNLPESAAFLESLPR